MSNGISKAEGNGERKMDKNQFLKSFKEQCNRNVARLVFSSELLARAIRTSTCVHRLESF